MSRIGVKSISLASIWQPLGFKKDVLFFDKIKISQVLLSGAFSVAFEFLKQDKSLDASQVERNLKEIDYLLGIDVVQLSKVGELPILTDPSAEESQAFFDVIEAGAKMEEILSKKRKREADYDQALKYALGYSDLYTRVESLSLSKQDNSHTYFPLLTQPTSFKKGEDVVFKFVFEQIPMPDDKADWKKVLEFRSDPDTKMKYYALMSWITNVSKEDLTATQLSEKFQWLYREYKNQYEIHKLEYQMTCWESIFVSTAELIGSWQTPSLASVLTSFYKVRKEHINLLKAEKSFIGRELAFISKAQNSFSKKM